MHLYLLPPFQGITIVLYIAFLSCTTAQAQTNDTSKIIECYAHYLIETELDQFDKAFDRLNSSTQDFFAEMAVMVRTFDEAKIDSTCDWDRFTILSLRLREPKNVLLNYTTVDVFTADLMIMRADLFDEIDSNQDAEVEAIDVEMKRKFIDDKIAELRSTWAIINIGKSEASMGPTQDQLAHFTLENGLWKLDLVRSTPKYSSQLAGRLNGPYISPKSEYGFMDRWVWIAQMNTGRRITEETWLPPAHWTVDEMPKLTDTEMASLLSPNHLQNESNGASFMDSLEMIMAYTIFTNSIREGRHTTSWLFLDQTSQEFYNNIASKIRETDREELQQLSFDEKVRILQARLMMPRSELLELSGAQYFIFTHTVDVGYVKSEDTADYKNIPALTGNTASSQLAGYPMSMIGEAQKHGDHGILYFELNGKKIVLNRKDPLDKYEGLHFTKQNERDWKFNLYRTIIKYTKLQDLIVLLSKTYLKQKGWTLKDWLPLMLQASTGKALTAETWHPPSQWQTEEMPNLSEEERDDMIREAYGWLKYVQDHY